MSKSLKKLIDINRLREFKNKLVGAGSAYVQTGAVDQTIAGTKTFSKLIVGSVTGSSGSCTGNAATATKATQDAAGNTITTTYATKAENNTKANNSEVVHKSDDETIAGTKTFNSPINSPVTTGMWINGNRGAAIINSTANAGYNVLFRMKSSHGVFTGCAYEQWYQINYTTDSIVNAGKNETTYTNTLIDENGNAVFSNNITVIGTINGNLNGNVTGNAATATTAATAANATYANWLRTSSHTDHLFHTEWDGAYFWTYVTAGDGGYRPVRVARSDSATTADTATKLTEWYAAYPDGAEAHNAMWGGRDITAAFDAGTVSEHIADGTFKDIFPGDYITKQVTIPQVLADDGTTELFAGGTYTVNWVIADCDYWINKGDDTSSITAHHVVIVPQTPIFDARMNQTNTTEGGYAGSAMYKKIIPACATGIVNAFGSSHILTFRDGITDRVYNSLVSGNNPYWTGATVWWGEWMSVQCNLMCEAMVYDGVRTASSAADNIMAFRQMSAFRLSEKLINYNRYNWWLRDVVSSAYFAFIIGHGITCADNASDVLGVRPFALLR